MNIEAMAKEAGFSLTNGSNWVNVKGTGDELRRFAKLIAEAEREACANSSPTWQPIDTAPKDGDEVWLYCPGDHPAQCAGFFSSDAGGRWEHCSKVIYDVAPEIFPTHWMPLPDAPKVEE